MDKCRDAQRASLFKIIHYEKIHTVFDFIVVFDFMRKRQ